MAVDIIARGMAGTAQETADTARKIVVPAYDPAATYNSNDIVFYEDKLYICVGTNVTGTFDPTKWQQIVLGDEITEIINKLDTMQYPLIIKGTVATVADLANIQNPQPGWIYFVGTTSDPEYEEYVYTLDNAWEYIGTAAVAIDDHLDGTSTNPVQNRVILNWLAPTYVNGATYSKNDIVYYRYGATDYGFFRAKVNNPHTYPSGADWENIGDFGAAIAKNFSEEVGKQTVFQGGEIFNDYDNNQANVYAHAEGSYTVAGDSCAHAEGYHTTASGIASHAEGNYSVASGQFAHAEGDHTIAAGALSHAQGNYTIANGALQFVAGKFNTPDTTSAVIIGNGTADNARSNALTVDWSGNVNASGGITATGAVISNQSNNAILRINNSQITGVSYVPTAGDGNPISSQAVLYALDSKADAIDTPKTFKKADLYDATTGTYAVKDTCVQAGVLYICNTAISTPEAFNSSKWDAVTNASGRLYMQPITEAAHNALLTIDPNTFYIIL